MERLDREGQEIPVRDQQLIHIYDRLVNCDKILETSRKVSKIETTKVLAITYLLSNEKLTAEIVDALKDTSRGQSLGRDFIHLTTSTEEPALVQKTQQQNSSSRRLLLARYEPNDEKGQHSIKEEGEEDFLLLAFDKEHESPYEIVGAEQIVVPEETAKICKEILEREEEILRGRTKFLVEDTF